MKYKILIFLFSVFLGLNNFQQWIFFFFLLSTNVSSQKNAEMNELKHGIDRLMVTGWSWWPSVLVPFCQY